MKPFTNYLIEAGISLGVFTLAYWFFLRKETRFNATRYYLLLALLFSTLLPFLTIRINMNWLQTAQEQQVTFDETNWLGTVTVYAAGIPAKVQQAIFSFDYSMLIYSLGALGAFFVIAAGIFQLLKMVSKNRVFKLKKARLVVSNNEQSPYSFFNYIFIGKNLTEQKDWKAMVQHEMEHVKQGHSFDVLFVDFMMVFQWFNPFYWILRRLVRENHEFLADTAVLRSGSITNANYKQLLLSQAIGGHPVITSNFFNVKTVKKRFKMITANNKNKYGFIRYTLGVTIALALTLMFACEDSANLVSSKTGDYIYNGEFVEMSEVMNQGIANLQVVKVEKLDVLLVYPELKDKLDKETYYIAFNANDAEQMELRSKLEIKTMQSTTNAVDELVVVAYGNPEAEEFNEQVFTIVEEMPIFPGGELELRKAIGKSVKYPVVAAENGIQGKVYVSFVVAKDGSIKNCKIARGVDPSLDAEALRVVRSLPLWQPGYQRGQAVNVQYTVPINFQLQ